jgi:diguanylate cyclase (GGDEF)-like protein
VRSLAALVAPRLDARPLRRITLGLLAGALAVYVAQLALGFAAGPLEWPLTEGLYYALIVAGALVCVARVVAVAEDRLAWGIMAAGLVAWAAAEVYWEAVLAASPSPPYPSPSDAGWLALYPAGYFAIVLLAGGKRRARPAGLWLDGLIAALGAGALAAAVLYEPIVASAVEGEAAAIAVNLAYPVGDLLVLAMIGVVLALQGWRPGRMWTMLAAGLALTAIADAWYLAEVARGGWQAGSVLNALWPASILLIGWAAWQPRRTDAVRLEGLRIVAAPVGFTLVGLALLTLDHFERLNALALVLSTTTLAAAALRMAVAYRANVLMLERSRRDAMTDALTGLGNRRRLMADLEAGMGPDGDPAEVLVLFDLDGFKRYNDTFGHPAGDALLQRLGRRLAGVVEGHGAAYRMGGDEFCVLLRDAGSREARVGAAVAALSERGDGFDVGASHGIVAPPAEAATAAEALQIADQRMYGDKARHARGRASDTRDVLVRVLREREPDLHDHLRHVAELARAVGLRFGLEPEGLDELVRAAELHDVGKMAIPDSILSKPGPLDEEEWAFMRRHTVIGEAILSAAPALAPIGRLVRASHERFDGTGYPDRVLGAEIPLGARIVAVCNAYDAMTSDRSYRRAMSPETATAELRRGAGSQFDPEVVGVFCDVLALAAR